MLSYKDLTRRFGLSLLGKEFQIFLEDIFSDLTEYNIVESEYIISEKNGIDLGFTNNEAVYDEDENILFEKGNSVFSHFNLHPKSLILIESLPFDTSFDDKRAEVMSKAGKPSQIKKGHADFLTKTFLLTIIK